MPELPSICPFVIETYTKPLTLHDGTVVQHELPVISQVMIDALIAAAPSQIAKQIREQGADAIMPHNYGMPDRASFVFTVTNMPGKPLEPQSTWEAAFGALLAKLKRAKGREEEERTKVHEAAEKTQVGKGRRAFWHLFGQS